MAKQNIKVGSQVKLLVGSKEVRGQFFAVKKVKGDRVFLDGYKLFKRTMKVSAENTDTHKSVHHSIHISNVILQS
jgi:ribosomal protein L24